MKSHLSVGNKLLLLTTLFIKYLSDLILDLVFESLIKVLICEVCSIINQLKEKERGDGYQTKDFYLVEIVQIRNRFSVVASPLSYQSRTCLRLTAAVVRNL